MRPFSQIYARIDSTRTDDLRARKRVALAIRDALRGSYSTDVGRLLERKLGIDIVEVNYSGGHVPWERFIGNANSHDLFDTIFWTAQFLGDKNDLWKKRFIGQIKEIFSDRQLAFRVDNAGTVHPLIDVVFEAHVIETLSGMNSPRYSAAKSFLEASERALMPAQIDYRSAIRAVFDSAETVYKLMFPELPRISAQNINGTLSKRISQIYGDTGSQARAVNSIKDGFKAWTEAAHNYRHVDGEEAMSEPSDETAIALISHGYNYVRWLVALDSIDNEP